LNIKPHNNLRRLAGDTPYGRFRIIIGNHDGPIFDADGNQIGTLTMEMREPSTRDNTPCAHRGEEVERRVCETCRGSVKVKVFACMEHGQCTQRTKFDDTPGCDRCKDYQPAG